MIVPANPLVMKVWSDEQAIAAWMELGLTRDEAKAYWYVWTHGEPTKADRSL